MQLVGDPGVPLATMTEIIQVTAIRNWINWIIVPMTVYSQDNIKPTNINIYFLLLTIPVTVYNLQLDISRLGHLAELHQTDKHNHFLKLMTIP